MTKLLFDPDFLKFVIPLFGGVLAWFLNESKKRSWEEYNKKEASYRELLLALKGFYEGGDGVICKDLKNKFIDQLNLCWLYCPDDVILAGNDFLLSLHTGEKKTYEERRQAASKLILLIRKDLLSRRIVRRTGLKIEDFRLLSST